MTYLENLTFDEIKVGDKSSLTRILSLQAAQLFAIMSGNANPSHLDKDFAKDLYFQKVVGNGMWAGSLVSTLIGTQLPGPGSICLHQSLDFHEPIFVKDQITVTVEVTLKVAESKQVTLACTIINQDGKTVISGEAIVVAPTEKIQHKQAVLPQISIYHDGQPLQEYVAKAKKTPAVQTAVVHPVSPESLQGAIAAHEEGQIEPILIGPEKRILEMADLLEADISAFPIIDTEHSHASAQVAAKMAMTGEVKMLMKGSLHTDELLHAVVQKENGLRTDRRLSHVFILDIPAYPKPLLLTDAAININPDLAGKKDIIQNAIDFAHAIGIERPKVGLLAAVETVNGKMQSTLDAAALCKMCDRGQISGAILDGPLAFDNAISKTAAKIKGIASPVAGDADILIAPNLEAGNMLAKQLEYLAHAYMAGIVLGARVPIILTSRADSAIARMLSCVFGKLWMQYYQEKTREKGCEK